MAIARTALWITGTTSDTKPPNDPDNTTFFIETDTIKLYIKVGGSYQQVSI